MAEDPSEVTSIFRPVTITKENLDRTLADMTGYARIDDTGEKEEMSSADYVANQIVNEIKIDSSEPDVIGSYDSLRNGSSLLFSDPRFPHFHKYANTKLFNNDKIISYFGVDEKGVPIGPGSPSEAFLREFFPSAFSLGGAFTGAKVGTRLQAPIPPVNPAAIVAKGAIPIVTTMMGAFGAYAGADKFGDAYLFDEEKPILPSSRAAYVRAETAGALVPWLLQPYMISDDIAWGATAYLNNIAQMIGPDAKYPNKKGPFSLRMLAGIEKILSKQGGFNISNIRKARREGTFKNVQEGDVYSMKEKITQSAAADVAAGTGAVFASGFAEEFYPGSTGARITFELGGSAAPAVLGNNLIIKGAQVLPKLKKLGKDLYSGELDLKGMRQDAGVQRIIEILEAEGQDVDAVIKALNSKEFSKFLVDQNGEPLLDANGDVIVANLTAGQKTGNAVLLAMEATLNAAKGGYGKEKVTKNVAADKALRNVIAVLNNTGDSAALQIAADLMSDFYAGQMTQRLGRATDNVLNAFNKVKGLSQETSIDLATNLKNMGTRQLELARERERELYKAVNNADLIIDNRADYAFLDVFENEIPNVVEEKAEVGALLRPLLNFVERKKKEFGLVDNQTELSIDSVFPDGAESFLTVEEARTMYSRALVIGKNLTAAKDPNTARIAFMFANAIRKDLDLMPAGQNQALDVARSYSKALNDVFNRSFAGKLFDKTKKGEFSIAPELLADQLLNVSNDATYLRVKSVHEIGEFGETYNLYDKDTGDRINVATIRGVTESILRNAKKVKGMFDLNTGAINEKVFNKFMEENKDLLNMFPSLKRDLQRADIRNFILSGRETQNKTREKILKSQISYMDLTTAKAAKNEDGVLIPKSGTENPVSAVAGALANANKQKLKSLNNLLEPIINNPAKLTEDQKRDALKGLKVSILEHGLIKAGGDSESFNARTLYDHLFRKIPGTHDITLSRWMVQNNVATEKEVGHYKKVLEELTKLESLDASNNLDSVIEQAGPILDLYLRITGSFLGTQTQKAIFGQQGGNSLIASAAGSKFVRTMFDKIPENFKMDVMSELLENPEMLALLMTKRKNAPDQRRVEEVVSNLFKELGFIPMKRVPAIVVKEEDLAPKERDDTEEKIDTIDTSAVVPEPRVSPVQTTNPLLISQNLPQAQPAAASGPVDRTKYAALFPNDMASSMIKGGIGGLMG